MKSNHNLLKELYQKHIGYVNDLVLNQKMNHVYCVIGEQNGAQNAFVDYWVELLICKDQCGKCNNCKEYLKETHVDLYDFSTKQDKILLQDAYQISKHLSSKPLIAKYRIVVIRDVHKMNMAAANALLKIIEEPPSYTCILMSTDQPDVLPTTIKSRIQQIRLPIIIRKQVEQVIEKELGQGVHRDVIIDQISGRYELLKKYKLAEKETFKNWKHENDYWFDFINAGIPQREKMITEQVKEGLDAIQMINKIESVIHDLFLGVHGVHSIAKFKVKPKKQDVISKMKKVDALKQMSKHNINKKMIFDYLIFGL